MNDLRIEQVARQIVDELRAGRRATFTTDDADTRNRIVARVRAHLAGRTVDGPPD